VNDADSNFYFRHVLTLRDRNRPEIVNAE